MIRKINKQELVKFVLNFFVLLIFINACNKREKVTNEKERFVFDYAFFLSDEDALVLEKFLDSLNRESSGSLFFCSIGNYEIKTNTDSLSTHFFKRLGIGTNDCLIFISESTRSVKILVGDTNSKYLTTAELDSITINIINSFKQEKYLFGLTQAYLEIFYKIRKETNHDV